MLKPARKKEKDPEGRMPLAEHLRELRNRLAKSVIAIVIVSIVSFIYYREIIEVFQHPIQQSIGCKVPVRELLEAKSGTKTKCGTLTMSGLTGPFALSMKVAMVSGLVLSSPVWLYQLWAFLAPGLHRHEKKYALSFVSAGVPLFAAGAWFAYTIMPTAAEVLIEFTPDGVTNLVPLDDLLDLIMRLIIVFGLSFELPLLLMLLNFGGVLTGRRMLGWWRGMIMGVTVFAAVATPTVDPYSMFMLAGPIVALYFIAVGIALLNDKRRGRANPDRLLDDDEAAPLDLTPQSVGDVEPLAAADRSGRDGHNGQPVRRNGFDDFT
ncbi:twin-arginine translocase subunit TatC [Streptomyces huiliensis]|uniref:twin-arginine translocase subunit TatC n=1 Tax=Streptomyces huiliensis TaxID=2876027 RepID=UPI001CBF3DC1|nr:twin-arginine translocase subunit TatC [Streptomyces huiliensis]MBZ4320186.1 twin-arginine translocase subunit TatC [Streptomyces huiliensis]